MDWDDITSAKGAGAKPGRVTLGAWLGLAVLVALHATLFVVGIVTWSSPCSYPLAPLLVAFGWLGAWTCSLFFRQWALFVKSGRAPTGMCACFHAAASISVGAALTVVTVIAWDSCWVTAPELSYCALGASLAFVLGTACGICVPMMRSVSVPAGFATAQAPVVAHRVGRDKAPPRLRENEKDEPRKPRDRLFDPPKKRTDDYRGDQHMDADCVSAVAAGACACVSM